MRFTSPFLAAALFLLAGCARMSPAAGTWTGQISLPPMMQIPLAVMGGGAHGATTSTVTLRPDGTGFVKIGPAPEHPVAWTEEDGKVILRPRDEASTGAKNPQPGANPKGTLVGTLSEDNRSMSVDLGVAKVVLQKQADAK
jgi:hypothetical protein